MCKDIFDEIYTQDEERICPNCKGIMVFSQNRSRHICTSCGYHQKDISCSYEGCFEEIEIPAHIWRTALINAHKHDINLGGYLDARSGCINFWCGPENLPDDPDWKRVQIKPHALKFPRSIVGGIYGEWLDRKKVLLHFCLYPHDKAEVIVGHPFIGYTYHDGRRVTSSNFATHEELKWIKKEFSKLIGVAI